jgi:hypothetical protein
VRAFAAAVWARALRLADSWRGAALVFALGLGLYWLEALAWPLQRGRDSWDYWLYYLQLGDSQPPFSQVMLFRTPVTPIVTGLPMSIGGAQLLEVVMSLIYAASAVAWGWAARPFGRRAAIATSLVVLVFQVPYAELFHLVSSDFVFGALLAGWAGLVVRAGLRPSYRTLLGVGAGAAVLTLARPAGQVVVLAAAAVALVAPGRLRVRVRNLAVVLLPAVALLLVWAGVNAARYDDFTVARGGKAWVPFYKVFNEGHIAVDNGPASRRLASAIARDVLTQPPYRRLHVDVSTYLRSPSNLESIRLIALSDQDFGRASNYDILYRAALEGIRHNLGTYVRSVSSTFWDFLTQRYALGPVRRAHVYPPLPSVLTVDGKPRPSPIALSPLVQAVRFGFVWCPTDDIDRCILKDPARAFPLPRDQHRYVQLVDRVRDWNAQLPLRNGQRWLAARLTTVSSNTPQPVFWIALSILGLAFRRPRGRPVLIVLLAAAALVLLVHAISQQAQTEYELPLAPLFALVAVASVLGPRRDESPAVSDETPG